MTNNQLTEEELQTLIIELQQIAYRLNGTNSAYLMSDAIKPLRELQERRKAAMDSEPVAYMTYKGYLLHAGDPKLAEFSEPTPLYADPRPAAMPAAPVAWLWSRDGDDERDVSLTPPDDDADAADAIECGWTASPLYRHAQQPLVPDNRAITQHFDTIALETAREILCDVNRRHEFLGGEVQLLSRIQCRIDAACRAAMLQGAKNSESRVGIQTAPALDSFKENADARCGNSPVIPDGYVMVPKEPTKEMIDAGWLHFMGTKNPSSKGTYEAMLAAAPQEEK
ncbi:hypothetical protein [Klebsiella michiganensis]|uniref:hypothetical protein n=1 Tax=Klebsiella michiganensis TaxID=1134687 RepID=UPI00069CF754|nr:hypothetical protein [Klebsiella michiganensis]